MKTAVVNMSDLDGCWSPLKYTHICHRCDKYTRGQVVNGVRQPCPDRYENEEYNTLVDTTGRAWKLYKGLKNRMDSI